MQGLAKAGRDAGRESQAINAIQASMARTKGWPLAASAASVAGPPAQPLTPDRLDAATVAASMRCHRIRAAMGNWSAGVHNSWGQGEAG